MSGNRNAHSADRRVTSVRSAAAAAAPDPRSVVLGKRTRPQPVRDAILAFMTEPRQAFEIARHTGKATASITGHMRTMLELGLVERIAYGRYARSGTVPVPPPHIALIRPHPLTNRVLGTLTEPKTPDEIAELLRLPVDRLLPHLQKMRKNGVIWCNRQGSFARIHTADDWQKRSETSSVLRNL